MTKPIGFLRNATLLRDGGNTPYQLEGTCVSHEERHDLVHRYMYSSLILNQVNDNTFETRNSIYKVLSWAEPKTEPSPEELEAIHKYFNALIV